MRKVPRHRLAVNKQPDERKIGKMQTTGTSFELGAQAGRPHCKTGRRDFLKLGAGAAAGMAVGGCATAAARAARGPVAPEGDIRAFFVNLGHNMWCDWYPEEIDTSKIKHGLPDATLRCRDDIWRRVTDRVVAKGLNQLVIDVGEGVVYPRRPELAIRGSWSAERLAAEVDRLHGLGLEVIPKLNFSTTHSGWMKQYRRMVGTPEYYRVCEDCLRDVSEIFGSPRLIHIGCDEEDGEWHVMRSKSRQYVVVRRGEVWKHDFLHLVRTVEGLGARAWAWSDYGWEEPAFLDWCPKSVLLSNWYYDESHGGFDPKTNTTSDHKRLIQFWQLEEAGFDQVPCGTNWVGWARQKEGVGADDVIGKLVQTCRSCISPAHLKGFLMAPWAACDTEKNGAKLARGVDLFADALSGKIPNVG